MSSRPVIHSFSHDALGARFWLRIADEEATYAKNAASGVFQMLDDLDFQLDKRHDSGPIQAINSMPEGALVTASDDLRAVWGFAQGLREETNGAFDVAAGALFDYWQQRGDLPLNADDAEWTKACSLVKDGQFKLEGVEFSCVKTGAKLDLGAIVRGYAVDKMAEMIENNWGIHRALLIGGGGVTLALDPPGDANGWRIGVGNHSEIKLCRFALASKSGSGIPGRLVDPRSGRSIELPEPVRTIATTGLEAEGIAMAAAVLSPAEAEEMVSRGCSRGVWQPDGTRCGSLTYFDITDRPIT
jgi:thiamine biosynthesis lipoprotein